MSAEGKGERMAAGTMYLIALLGSAALSAALVPLAMRLASAWGLVDQPGLRKVHAVATPRVGGLGFMAAAALVAVPLLAYAGLLSGEAVPRLSAVAATLGLIVGVGLLDDAFDVPGKYKLLAVVAAAVALCAAGVRIDEIVLRDGTIHPDLGWAAWPVTILWVVGVVVSVNFIDGLDGLAAGVGGIAAVALGLVAIQDGAPAVAVCALCLAGALIAFLLYNKHPARVFMGDCGSMGIGFALAALCLLGYGRDAEAGRTLGFMSAFVVPGLALSVPIVDTMLTMIRRPILHRRSIFSAERGHIHHRLLDVGLTHRYAVLLLWGTTFAAAVLGLLARQVAGWAVLGVVPLIGLVLVFVFRLAGSVRARETLLALRRNRALKRDYRRWAKAAEEGQLRVHNARSFEEWWRQVCTAAEGLGFASLRLGGRRRDGEPFAATWARGGDVYGGDEAMKPDAAALSPKVETLRASLPVPQRRTGDPLSLECEVIVEPHLESAAHRVQLMGRLLSEYSVRALNRFDAAANVGVGNVERRKRWGQAAAPAAEPDLLDADSTPAGEPRVAVVHDFLYTYAGAERVLEQMLEEFPRCDLFALVDFLPADKRDFIRNKPVKTSFIQRMPLARRKHRMYLPLMPLAIEQLNLSSYDVVLSSSYLAAKGVITRPDQLHVCYCHSPPRWAWDLQNQYLAESRLAGGGLIGTPKSLLARALLHYVRNWDVRSANGVDLFLSNSRFVARRIGKTYRRKAKTLYPPVDTKTFRPAADGGPRQDFYLTASRMVPYKKIDLIVEAFRDMPDKRLVVVGGGPDYEKIRAKARGAANIKLAGPVGNDQLVRYMQSAKAFVFAAEEDFGIVPVEAMACGTPVIAFGRGGVTESVVDGQTGVLFPRQTPDALREAVGRFEALTFDHDAIRRRAETFSRAVFRRGFRAVVDARWEKFARRGKMAVNRPDDADAPAAARGVTNASAAGVSGAAVR